jgi:hypothetical protein
MLATLTQFPCIFPLMIISYVLRSLVPLHRLLFSQLPDAFLLNFVLSFVFTDGFMPGEQYPESYNQLGKKAFAAGRLEVTGCPDTI